MKPGIETAAICGLFCGTCPSYPDKCGEFPCVRLEAFSKKHIANGIFHHERIVADLRRMEKAGVEAWVDEQTQAHTCSTCGKLVHWFERACPGCGG